ncbi:aldose 1-epimerase family protein [Flavitalea sp.]|nr:aldose 1-epimerase family protein [Flavitalea sp.]
MITIENENLRVTINPKGAELTSIFNKETQLEYMWEGDPAIWGKYSPVLFPIIGTLKENLYRFNNKDYSLPRHGFARERIFSLEDHQQDECVFSLSGDEETMAVYPFEFRLRIKYALLQNTVAVSYEVQNPAKQPIYFSIGAHPAFKVPLSPGTIYEDYYLQFEKVETANRWPITKDGLIDSSPLPLLTANDRLPLSKNLFASDAIVFKSLKSSVLSLKSEKTPHGLEFSYAGFPYMGLWAAKGGDFVCIEPWCGIADPVNSDQLLEHKEGINKLAPGEKFVRTWTAKFF